MPVLRFHSIEELDDRRSDLWCEEPDDAWFRRVARLWLRSSRLSPRRFPPGVHRHRSVEEAAAQRDDWLRDHVRRLRAERER